MNTKFTKMMTVLALMTVAMAGCKKPKETKVPKVAIIEDSVVATHNLALLYAEVTDESGAEITGCGFCYGKQGGPSDTLFCDGNGSLFFVELTNLLPSTLYTCKAFADNTAGRGYSKAYDFTTQGEPFPVVKTYNVTNITVNSAVAHGQVVSDGGQEVLERGVCFDTQSRPTINDLHVAAGSGLGRFECQLTGLPSETVYYLRAYAVCTEGVYYGEEKLFGTDILPLEVQTVSVEDVTATRAVASGKVIRDGGYEVTESGFCWGTEHEPTIEGHHVKVSVGLGDFSGYFSVFERGQTHYLRAYAINEAGVAYGRELEFVPNDPFLPWPNGTSPGLFSVSADRQVRFSYGNLQYNPSAGEWRFAEHQWDFVGGPSQVEQLGDIEVGTVYENGVKCDNTKVTVNYDGWIDLFGWGTSGWNNGNRYYQPWDFASSVADCSFYGPIGNFDLTGEYARADWGVNNPISNGGFGPWRTPSADEFKYLLTERTTPSGVRFAMAIVAGVRGMVVLPDDWSPSTYYLRAVNGIAGYSANIISGKDWLGKLEPAGAVFLPAGGGRLQFAAYDGIYFDWFNNEIWFDYGLYGGGHFSPLYVAGSYWTTSQGGGVSQASALVISCVSSYEESVDYYRFRSKGYSVRLISDE